MSTADFEDDTLVDIVDHDADSEYLNINATIDDTFLKNFEVDLGNLAKLPQQENTDVFYQIGQLFNAKIDRSNYKTQIVRLINNKNQYMTQNSKLKAEAMCHDGAIARLVAKNEGLKLQVAQLHDINRQTEEKRAEAQHNFETVSNYTNRLNDHIRDLTRQLSNEQATHREELEELKERLQKIEDENDKFRILQGTISPTFIIPITPPKRKQPKSYGLPHTPQKNNSGPQIYFGGGKVKSINAELQKAWVNSKYYKPGDSTSISGSSVFRGHTGLSPERRVMVNPDDFEAYQDAFASDEPEFANRNPAGETYDMLKRLARTATKPKTNAKKVTRPKKMVSKKQAGRNATAHKAAPKRASQYLLESSDEEVLVTGRGRRMDASAQAQAQAEYEKEDEASDYFDDDSDFQDDGYKENDWSFDCVCGFDDKGIPDIECTVCKNWGHANCYGLDVKTVSKDYIHLCPPCAAEAKAEEEAANTTNDKKRKRSSDDEGSENDSTEHDELTGGKGKKPRPNAWSKEEKDNLELAMKKHFDMVRAGEREEVYDTNLFKLISQDILKMGGVERNANACKNMWNRELREATGLDERRQKNPSKLATSIQ